ncbi:tyrosinase family protein [Mesorhizobium sp. ZMM04-5]|uniref:Tyrosinase family protein n=1 Tax=Mesorhizobium marinum TaxID=3228790 RepID=A0ABV3R4B9_9HYPH
MGVLARVAVAATLLTPVLANAQSIEVEVRNSASADDDYFCWTPVEARVRALNSMQPMQVTIAADAQAGGGGLVFQGLGATRPTAATFQPVQTLSLTLPQDSSWVPFWVAGSAASVGAKDVSIVVTDEANAAPPASLPVMVRVRKDARTLTQPEIDTFLSALRTLHDVDGGAVASRFVKYASAHAQAFNIGIHHATDPGFWPLFLAWHRAFLLSLERELQAIDKRVALPYWRFDQPDPGGIGGAPRIFNRNFMGSISGGALQAGGFRVTFAPTNPLFGWNVPGLGALVRTADATGGTMPANRLQTILDLVENTTGPDQGAYKLLNGRVELRYHNGAHGAVGGWLGQGYSPADPLFFLLHANTDRAWAVWQHANPDRFVSTLPKSYHAQGAYPGPAQPGRFRMGSYLDDVMWPWSGLQGDQGTPDRLDDWPSLPEPFPATLVDGVTPSPKSTVDYLDVLGAGTALDACYDDLAYPH